MLKGELIIGEKKHDKTTDSNLILLEKGNKLIVKANKTSQFLFIAGKPIGEPIARGGPFVMNTKAEILEAIQDYNNEHLLNIKSSSTFQFKCLNQLLLKKMVVLKF